MKSLMKWPFRRGPVETRASADLIQYLTGELDRHQMRDVESRLASDQEYMDAAWPVVELLTAPVNLGDLLDDSVRDAGAPEWKRGAFGVARRPALPDERMMPAYARLRSELGLAPRSLEQFQADCARYEEQERIIALDSGELDEHESSTAVWWKRPSALASYAAAAAIIVTVVSFSWSQHQLHVHLGREQQEVAEHRASTAFMPDPRVFDVGADDARLVTLDAGVRVLLKPSSRLSTEDQAAALDGSAEIDVPVSTYLVVRTPTAHVLLMHGGYHIDAPTSGLPTLVRVDSGQAHVEGNAEADGGTVLRTGEAARIGARKTERVPTRF